ncbi:hypothetical protein LV78_006910 [Actinosynnema pretiosum]|nr:hypothetical protein [Actinosynnema pretiosum]
MFDLVDPRDRVRARALAKQRALVTRSDAAVRDMNAAWRACSLAGEEREAAEAAALRCAAAFGKARGRTVHGRVDAFRAAPDDAARAELWPFALLFLRWENRYPDEWRASGQWSSWTTKDLLLRDLGRRGVPEAGEGVELVVAALERPYRCKDWMFARLARRVDGDLLRDRLGGLAGREPRARFVLDLLDRPELPASRGAWARWRAADPTATSTTAHVE